LPSSPWLKRELGATRVFSKAAMARLTGAMLSGYFLKAFLNSGL
jgi:hypothetical protein